MVPSGDPAVLERHPGTGLGGRDRRCRASTRCLLQQLPKGVRTNREEASRSKSAQIQLTPAGCQIDAKLMRSLQPFPRLHPISEGVRFLLNPALAWQH